jgi:hypothetical protein
MDGGKSAGRGRRALTVGALGLLASLALIPALAADASPRVYFAANCMNAKVKPKLVILACADANFYVNRLQWGHWGNAHTTARGTAHVRDCDPSCVGGTFHKYPGKLRLSRIRTCPQDGLKHYTQTKFTFPGARPQGTPRHLRQGYPCSLLG